MDRVNSDLYHFSLQDVCQFIRTEGKSNRLEFSSLIGLGRQKLEFRATKAARAQAKILEIWDHREVSLILLTVITFEAFADT